MADISLSSALTFITTVCLLPLCVVSDISASQLNPIPGRQTYFDTLGQAVFQVQKLHILRHHNVTTIIKDILSDLSYLQTGIMGHRLDKNLASSLISEYLDAFQETDPSLNQTCLNDAVQLVLSWLDKNETWSLQFLDAFGKPGPSLMLYRLKFIGNYKQCREAHAPSNKSYGQNGFSGNYCTLIANVPGTFIPLAQLGLCLPDTCSENDLEIIGSKMFQKLTNGSVKAECHTDVRELTTATLVAISFLTIICGLVLCGTVADIIYVQRPKWRMEKEHNDVLARSDHRGSYYGSIASGERFIGQSEETDETLLLLRKPVRKTGVCFKFLVAFSLYTNGSKVLNTSQPPGSLGAVHGIRFLSMSWVILAHVYIFGVSNFENIDAGTQLLKRWTFTAVANGFSSVDTFFTLSGLLTAYLTYQQMKTYGWKINWGLYYFHRFWRLTPPYMLILLMVLGFQQYLGSGALWSNIQPQDRDNCNQYWWANLLYINNLISTKNLCFGHSWYLSNDMQFFLISPLLIVPFYFKTLAGVIVCLAFLVATSTATGVLSYFKEWSVWPMQEKSPEGDWFENYYIKPWCRAGPYIVGVLNGVLLAHYRKVQMPKLVVALGWILAAASGLAVVYGVYGDLSGDNPSSVSMAAFYNSVSRSAWAMCVCWVIVACVSGYGGFVNHLLSWSPFVVLGRLTFVAYLIHPCILFVYFQNMESLYFVTDTSIAVTFCGILMCTYLVSFILMLLFESPMIGLEKALLHQKQN